jgi:hypothetical protein
MSFAYNQYLEDHIGDVLNAYWWLKHNLPEVTYTVNDIELFRNINNHDDSKYSRDEYEAYDDYFYGKDKNADVKKAFDYAWLHHIHNNPHHWQFWVLINDEAAEGIVALDMPHNYIIEMICDWWSFSWKTGNLREIFKWYDEHKNHMKLSDKTRETVEDILGKIKDKLDELESDEDDE